MFDKRTTIALVGTIVLLIIFAFILLRHDSQPLASDQEVLQQETALNPEHTNTTEPHPLLQFPTKEQAELYINQGFGRKNGADDWEHVVFGVVKSETDPDVVYFATEGYRVDTETHTGFQGIYRLNTKTFAWDRLLKSVAAKHIQELHVVGIDGDSLVLLHDTEADTDDDTDCHALTSSGDRNAWEFYQLSLKNPGKGLTLTSPPEDLQKTLGELAAACR